MLASGAPINSRDGAMTEEEEDVSVEVDEHGNPVIRPPMRESERERWLRRLPNALSTLGTAVLMFAAALALMVIALTAMEWRSWLWPIPLTALLIASLVTGRMRTEMMLLLAATTAYFAYHYYFLSYATGDVVARLAKEQGVEACWREIQNSDELDGNITEAKWRQDAELTGFTRGGAPFGLSIWQVGGFGWAEQFKNIRATLILSDANNWVICDYDLARGFASTRNPDVGPED
jgi:hypothetical protein